MAEYSDNWKNYADSLKNEIGRLRGIIMQANNVLNNINRTAQERVDDANRVLASTFSSSASGSKEKA